MWLRTIASMADSASPRLANAAPADTRAPGTLPTPSIAVALMARKAAAAGLGRTLGAAAMIAVPIRPKSAALGMSTS
jgi:hypothetical protein